MPAVIRKAEQYWLTVAAVEYRTSDSQYRETSYTNQCGRAKRYCLAAVSDGSNYKPGQGGAEQENGGISGAAPAVSGGLAVIKQAFPSKDRRWSRRRILATRLTHHSGW